MGTSPTATEKPWFCLFHCGGWRRRDGNRCTPVPEPNSWWLASRCGAGMWWPLSLCVLPPHRTPDHQAVSSFHSAMGRTSCYGEDKRAQRREDDLHLGTGDPRSIARFCMIWQNRNSCGSRKQNVSFFGWRLAPFGLNFLILRV